MWQKRATPQFPLPLCKGSTVTDWLPINSRRENLIGLAKSRCPPLVPWTMTKKASVTEHKYDCLWGHSTAASLHLWTVFFMRAEAAFGCSTLSARCPGHSEHSKTICQKDECTKDLTNEENRGIENTVKSSNPALHLFTAHVSRVSLEHRLQQDYINCLQ